MHALISDIHGNLEALEAVFEHIDAQGTERIVCLGDLVGYGPDPEAVVDRVRERCEWCLSGNHDYALLTQAVNFNPVAKQAIDCTRERMEPHGQSTAEVTERWEYLQGLLLTKQEDDCLYVHGSPRDERNEYITAHDTYFGPTDKLLEVFDMVPRLLFIGHTHRPGIITPDFEFVRPQDFDFELNVGDGGKYIINVSSVGQPRDGDSRACYATFDRDVVRFHRVDYDYQTTMRKIFDLPCVDRICADRLALGK